MARWAWLPLVLLSALLPGSRIVPNATPGPTRPIVDVVVVASQYEGLTRSFEERATRLATELGNERTLAARRLVYAEAATAVHEMDGELLRLPLFPTPLRTHWKDVLMANRHLEDLYLELSVAGSLADLQTLEGLLPLARFEQLAADNALREDLLLPPRSTPSSP